MRRLGLWSRFHFSLLCLLCFFSSSCSRAILKCRSEYLDPLYLAGEQIGTPDPCRFCFYGQQIVVYWNFRFSKIEPPVNLLVHLRFGTREIETIEVPITHSKGYWTYQLVNADYWCQGGVLSFQAQICRDGCVLAEWTHHLWSEIIEIGSS